jgi:hypothetical protein
MLRTTKQQPQRQPTKTRLVMGTHEQVPGAIASVHVLVAASRTPETIHVCQTQHVAHR